MATAEAAGLSRVTLYRIEQGEPSVAMGAYLNVAHALGVEVGLSEPGAREPAPGLPRRVRPADYPQLEKLAWQVRGGNRHHCLFGGGTAIVLTHGEYRESVDVDFLVSDRAGYRELRARLTRDGLPGITRRGTSLRASREVRADQYGLRTMLLVGSTEIKFEVVFESRVALEAPGETDRVCGVATLSVLDMATTKLLHNSDRWADDAVFSRDLIDLAMLNAPRKLLARAHAKARAAYGDSVERDLHKAIVRLRDRKGRLEACLDALKVSTPGALVWSRIRRLVPRGVKVG